MSAQPPARLGTWIARVLRVGTLGAVAVIAVGFAVALVSGTSGPGARPVTELVRDGGPDAVSTIGLLALTLLPLGVLGVAAFTFGASGERRYLAASLVTISLLVASLVVAALAAAPS